MELWWKTYLPKWKIFQSQGWVEGHPSKILSKYFAFENCDYIGHCHKYVKYNDVQIINDSLLEFFKSEGIDFKPVARMINGTKDGGFKAIAKYERKNPELDVAAWYQSGDWLRRHFFSACAGSQILTQDEVIVSMDKTTSAGYPLSLEYHDKNGCIGTEAWKVIEDYWNLIKDKNPKIVPIWTCSQKKEMRKNEKVDVHDIRVFTASPSELSSAMNRMCLDFNEKFYEAQGKTWSSVGINKFSSGWDVLYSRLNKHPNKFALDQSTFDASIFEAALYDQMEIRWEFLDEKWKNQDNRNRLEEIYYNIIHSLIILDNGEVIMKHIGNPSGSSNTVVDNTMINWRLFAYAWILLCREWGRETSYLDFMNMLECALYGDDNTFSESDEVREMFTPEGINKIWTNIGVKTKAVYMEPHPLEDLEFLSQGFRYDEKLGIVVPVPDTDKMLSSLLYGSKIDDVRWHLMRAFALRNETWGNLELRGIISRYITFVMRNYSKHLVGECNGLTMDQIYSTWKSDLFLSLLYTGNEVVVH